MLTKNWWLKIIKNLGNRLNLKLVTSNRLKVRKQTIDVKNFYKFEKDTKHPTKVEH